MFVSDFNEEIGKNLEFSRKGFWVVFWVVFRGIFLMKKGLKTGQKHRIQRIPSNPRF
jgi:L-lactate permease